VRDADVQLARLRSRVEALPERTGGGRLVAGLEAWREQTRVRLSIDALDGTRRCSTS
jgi:hypothetical protein